LEGKSPLKKKIILEVAEKTKQNKNKGIKRIRKKVYCKR